jgi:indolepyruvate decarboxylase
MAPTVIQHVLGRLKQIGITDVFGVPGDYSFPVNDAICLDPALRWIGCCNELNAAYAADGYARIKGVGALCTTYGVGELSALNGVAGACAEHLPLFHLVGAPSMRVQAARAVMHHTLGDGEYGFFKTMTEPVVCASAVMTPQNVAAETERLIAAALYHRRPVYMAFPADLAEQPVLSAAQPLPLPRSDPATLAAVVDAILRALDGATRACFLPGFLVARAGLQPVMRAVIEAAGRPFATMLLDKSILSERHPLYIGIYDGGLMNDAVRDYVEGCGCVIAVGAVMSDLNTGAFTARLEQARTISIGLHHTRVGEKQFFNVEIGDVLTSLAARLSRAPAPDGLPVPRNEDVRGGGGDPITAETLYPRWAHFLRPDDILIAETGTISMGLGFAHLPEGANFYNQTLWGSIGWATPAALGAALAAPDRRTVLVTGEGAHQMTAQEIGQFARLGLRPVIFVLNNAGYLIERLLCRQPEIAYNDLASWSYAALPQALGCAGWFTTRATTCGELDAAMEVAGRGERAAYIEIVTGAYEAPPLAAKLHESLGVLSQS